MLNTGNPPSTGPLEENAPRRTSQDIGTPSFEDDHDDGDDGDDVDDGDENDGEGYGDDDDDVSHRILPSLSDCQGPSVLSTF